MKKLQILCFLFIITTTVFADDKIIRDTNGKVVATINKTATGITVRNASGSVIESRQKFGKTIIVRDAAGKVIREEVKAKK